MPSLWDSAAGLADDLAGSTDEAVARTFDDEAGGGIIDGTTETIGAGYDTVAGTADHLAGSTDEAFARQFDDEAGGGILDYDTYAGWADHMAGSTDEAWARQFDSTPGGGFADLAGDAANDGVDVAGDALIDMTKGMVSFEKELLATAGKELFGGWYQWWMAPAALLSVLFIFRDEIATATGAGVGAAT
ncbi:hypothetical protein [Haloarchaeobius sp. DFWS5]|uniref:hypothetical protein n=1 Tax=Haloarchaeobius sp. DFWS5 TaxID=3446114 RepID=UPI003EBC2674